MGGIGSEWWRPRLIGMVVITLLVMASLYIVTKDSLEHKASSHKVTKEVETHFVMKVSNSQRHPHHVWPVSPSFIALDGNNCVYRIFHVILRSYSVWLQEKCWKI